MKYFVCWFSKSVLRNLVNHQPATGSGMGLSSSKRPIITRSNLAHSWIYALIELSTSQKYILDTKHPMSLWDYLPYSCSVWYNNQTHGMLKGNDVIRIWRFNWSSNSNIFYIETKRHRLRMEALINIYICIYTHNWKFNWCLLLSAQMTVHQHWFK